MQAQAERVMTNLRRLPNDLEKYVALNGLHDRNEALFFRVVADNIDEIQPLIYTLHSDGGPCLPKIRSYFSAAARPLHQRQRSRTHC
jgi:hypothetical protein